MCSHIYQASGLGQNLNEILYFRNKNTLYSEERFLTGPILVFGDRLLDALFWPANEPYADRLCDIWVPWPAMISYEFPVFLEEYF